MKVFGHEVKGKTVAIVVGVGVALALLVSLMSKKSAASAEAGGDATGSDLVGNDSSIGFGGPVSGAGGATAGSGVDPNTLLQVEAQIQNNQLLAAIQQAQIAAAQAVQTTQAKLNAQTAAAQIQAQKDEAQTAANTQRTDTIISVGVPAIFGLLGKIFGSGNNGVGSGTPSNIPSGPSFGAPGFSGGASGPTFAEEPFGTIGSLGAFNLI